VEDTETLDRVVPRPSDQQVVPTGVEGATDKNGYVEVQGASPLHWPTEAEIEDLATALAAVGSEVPVEQIRHAVMAFKPTVSSAALRGLDPRLPTPGVVDHDDGQPVCTCTLTHRCPACRDGLVGGLGAWSAP